MVFYYSARPALLFFPAGGRRAGSGEIPRHAAVCLIILSVSCTYNLVCLELQRRFTLFDKKLGFSVNGILRNNESLILKRPIADFTSR